MKSAYELAMERFEKEHPEESKPLTEAQKKALADLDEKYRSKLAEREIFLKEKLVQAQRSGQREEAEAIQKQIASERTRIEEEREAAKEKVRQQKN